jgi:hypothetical protein
MEPAIQFSVIFIATSSFSAAFLSNSSHVIQHAFAIQVLFATSQILAATAILAALYLTHVGSPASTPAKGLRSPGDYFISLLTQLPRNRFELSQRIADGGIILAAFAYVSGYYTLIFTNEVEPTQNISGVMYVGMAVSKSAPMSDP